MLLPQFPILTLHYFSLQNLIIFFIFIVCPPPPLKYKFHEGKAFFFFFVTAVFPVTEQYLAHIGIQIFTQ